jgi:hypothetical protein
MAEEFRLSVFIFLKEVSSFLAQSIYSWSKSNLRLSFDDILQIGDG